MKEPTHTKKPKPALEPENRPDPTKMLEAADTSSTSRVVYPETVYVPGSFKYDPTKSFEANQVPPLSLRVTDQRRLALWPCIGSTAKFLEQPVCSITDTS